MNENTHTIDTLGNVTITTKDGVKYELQAKVRVSQLRMLPIGNLKETQVIEFSGESIGAYKISANPDVVNAEQKEN